MEISLEPSLRTWNQLSRQAFNPFGAMHKHKCGVNRMSKKAADHHRKAAEYHTHAARHHGEAAKHHETGQHEKAAHHAHLARAHAIHARGHSEEATKAHHEQHGDKQTT